MGGANQIWNSITVYPLWATMAVGAAVFTVRAVQWLSMDQDMQMSPTYRKTDPADSDFLDKQGPAHFNHSLRKWMHSRPASGVHVFPEPALAPSDDSD